jgi:hypothetical protein
VFGRLGHDWRHADCVARTLKSKMGYEAGGGRCLLKNKTGSKSMLDGFVNEYICQSVTMFLVAQMPRLKKITIKNRYLCVIFPRVAIKSHHKRMLLLLNSVWPVAPLPASMDASEVNGVFTYLF